VSRQLLAEYPNMNTLFMSGYTDWINDNIPEDDQKITFISKPFTIKDLLAAVNKSLSLTIR